MTKLPEFIYAYDREGNRIKRDLKGTIIEEQREAAFRTGDSPFAVEVIYLLLFHPEQGVYVVQRANKREDPYLWSTSVGGHVSADEQADQTMSRESGEELKIREESGEELKGIETILVSTPDDFVRIVRDDPLDTRAVARKIQFVPWLGTYRIDRETKHPWLKRTHAHIYVGVFRGMPIFGPESQDTEFMDGTREAIAAKTYPKEELKRILSQNDPRFSNTLGVLVDRYHAFLGDV